MSYLSTGSSGSSGQVADSQKIQDAVKRVQQYASDIKKQTGMLATATSSRKQKAEETWKAAQACVQEARELLQNFGTGTGLSVSEQNHRRLMQQKLSENLNRVCKQLEECWTGYEAADAELVNRLASNPNPAVDMRSVDLEEGSRTEPLLSNVVRQVEDVSLADVETHAEIVQEYAHEITNLSSDVIGLHRAMVDLAEHAKASGDVLDSIEANMSFADEFTTAGVEQIQQASARQRTGSKFLLWVLAITAVLCVVVIFIMVER
mmetsp:Transcript_42951/g.113166  ORF Transcript_42951/g.113166 Transcript_42951/m.113166 type:complete len:263 (-) Transcript_42951:249-1037(-)